MSFLSLLEVKKTICTVKRVDIVQIKGITFHRNDKNVFYDSFYSFFFRGLSFPDLGGLSFLGLSLPDLGGLSFPDLGGLSFLGLRSEVCVF